MWQAYCNYYDCMLNESKWFCDSLGKTMFSWPSQQTLPDLQSKRLPSVICKIVNSGRICWNILNFFGPFGPMLRTLQWSFTDNRLKCNPLGPPARGPTLSSWFLSIFPFHHLSLGLSTPPSKRLAHHLCQSSICYICIFICTPFLFWIAFPLHVCSQIPTPRQGFFTNSH